MLSSSPINPRISRRINRKVTFCCIAIACLVRTLFVNYNPAVIKGKEYNVTILKNIGNEQEKHNFHNDVDRINLIRRENIPSDISPSTSSSQIKSFSNSSSSLMKAYSYDLLSHPDAQKVRQILLDYRKENETAVSCKLESAKLHPYHTEIKLTALASFPRSGNTWLRTLIEKSTGYQTSSVYCDRRLYSFKGECAQSNHFFMKTHEENTSIVIGNRSKNYDQFIYLVRNPFDAILSYLQFGPSGKNRTKNGRSAHEASLFLRTSVALSSISIEMIEQLVKEYYENFRYWRSVKLPYIDIRYEDLKKAPGIILRYVIMFLVPVSVENYDDHENGTRHNFSYYFDNPSIFSGTNDNMSKYIEEGDQAIACAIEEDVSGTDAVYEMSNNSHQAPAPRVNFGEYVPNYNTMPSAPPKTNEYERRIQLISIMLFILLFIPSVTVILYYALPLKITIPHMDTGMTTQRIVVSKPSFEMYTQLSWLFPDTLQCECSQPSINYGQFIHIEVTFHQVCSSDFVQQSWIDYLQGSIETSMFKNDFRVTAAFTFQALRTFCEMTNKTIRNGIDQFYSNQHLSIYVIPLQLLKAKIESLTDRFQSSLTNNLLSSLAMNQGMVQVNALFSALQTNFHLGIADNNSSVWISANTYENCSCATSSKCVTQSSIYDYPSSSSLFTIPGFYTGCYVTEGLLQSALECFYNQRCIDSLQFYLNSSSPMKITPLNASLPTRYSVSATIMELLYDLMIEKRNITLSYGSYYDTCNPSQCAYTGTYNSTGNTDDIVYTFAPSKNIIHVVIIVLGTIGGLATLLQFIVALLVRPIVCCLGNKSRNVMPEMSTVRT